MPTPKSTLPEEKTILPASTMKSLIPLTPWACRARAAACLPRPIEDIFIRPLSISERKSVCFLILPTITTPSASWAMRSIKTGTPSFVSPSSTTSIEDRTSAPTDSSVMPRLARISTCPSAVAPPWLPIAGTMKGLAPASLSIRTSERSTPSMPEIPRLPAVIAISMPGSILSPISPFSHCSRSASPTSSTRGLGKSCLTFTNLGKRTLAPFLRVVFGRGLDPLLSGLLDRRRYAFEILAAEEAVLPRVGVQAGDGHSRALDAELAQGVVGEQDHGQLALGPDPLYRLSQGDVGAHVYDLQLVGNEHHRVVLRTGELGEDLGVPRVVVARQVHRLLVQRRGRYRPDAPRARQLRCPLQVAERRVASPRIELAERQVRGELAHGEHVNGAGLMCSLLRLGDGVHPERQPEELRGALEDAGVPDDEGASVFPEVRIGEGPGDDLGSDPRRVSHRDGYKGRGHESRSFSSPRSLSTTLTNVSASPKPPALVTTRYGLGPIRVPTGIPGAASSSSRIPTAPSRRATATAVSPPVSTRASKSSCLERAATTPARASANDPAPA